MKPEAILGLVSAIREKANKSIVQYLKDEGIEDVAPSHGAILAMLYQHGNLTMSELAQHIKRDNSTVTTLVAKLEAAGYVEKIKNPEDRRITNICLTGKGSSLQPVFDSISKKLIQTIYQDFSDLEKEILIRLLEKILKNC